MEYRKVIIVGGGVAGLGAAKTLGPNVNYLLIEAQDYLGGRILTIDAAENVAVDVGAQFIHGKEKNILYEICEQLNCISDDSNNLENGVLVILSDGTELDSEIMQKAKLVWDDIVEEAQAKFGDTTIPAHYSLADYLQKHLKERLLSSLSCSDNIIDALIDHFSSTELIENGCLTLSDLSLIEYGSFEYLDGEPEYEFKNGGYRPFISYMKSFIPDDNRIRLNSEVIRVKYLEDSHQLLVHIRHHNKTNEEEISTILCDHMIWTSSLGYLKENFSLIFSNEIKLIEQKQTAINNLGFDTINKVAMVYEKSFWPEDNYLIILLHTQKQKLLTLVESLKALLNTKETDIQTIIEAIHMYEVLSSAEVPVLICWFGGPAALLLENLSEKVIGQICHEVLCNYLNISSELNQPKHVLKSEWHKNRFVRGSYSYCSTKSTTKDREQLRTGYAPDGIPRIQFAGEATHAKFYSTVHGALESGIREGTELLSIINK
ncbi:unnamed protein product [Adineta steineri]|uniref:Amine oxidase domain-containing protein n=1 Tax=Adineta steineri TaxID=433720 RepID=A0A818JFZ7_9BILA|nr:unnamed protein product [Adineta steineri]CAF3540334.1 unnamed protein product [Adineta steineri]